MIETPTLDEPRALVPTSKSTDERRTPAWLLDALREEFPFTIDVAAREPNRQVEHYLGPDHPLLEHRDGLAAPWDTGRLAGCLIKVEPAFAWCNPPYSRGQVMRWCAKALAEVEARRVTTVMLLQADVSTRYWHEYIEPREHRIIKRRLSFEGAPVGIDGRLAPAKVGSVLVIFRPTSKHWSFR
jgi:phage N-6-adenine-methyltransferase